MVPRTGLIAEYLFSGSARDTSGREQHGVVHGASPSADRFGRANSAYSFDGRDDYIEVTPPPQLNATALSVSVWARYGRRRMRGFTNCIVAQDNGRDDDQSHRVFQLSTLGERIIWHRMVGARDPMCKTRIRPGAWYHIVAVFDSDEHRLYVDGALCDTVKHTLWTHATQPLHIGRKGTDESYFFFRGSVDDLRIYDRALTLEDIGELYREDGFSKPQVPAVQDITGHWGRDGTVFLDLSEDGMGSVTGQIMAGKPSNMADIAHGSYDHVTGRLALSGDAKHPDTGAPAVWSIEGVVDGDEVGVVADFRTLDSGDRYYDNVILSRRGARRRWWRESALRATLLHSAARADRFLRGLSRPSPAKNAALFRSRGETATSFVLRDATVEDIPALSRVHVTAWNATYNTARGPTVATREWQWRQTFAKIDGTWFVVVVENPKHELVGFVRGIRRKDGTGDLNKIYLLTEYQRFGLGSAMLADATRRFLAMGVSTMSAYVDPGNPSCAFFERTGAHHGREDSGRINRDWYVWDDLNELARRLG